MTCLSWSMPKVSVIVPAYNAERTILPAVQSILDQTWSDLEIIVVNDGSTDATRAVLSALRDQRISLLTCDKHGVAAARNHGIAISRGEFIAFLDADDLWTRDKLQLQLEALDRRPVAGAAYSWTAFVDDCGRFLFAKVPQYVEGDVYRELLVNFFLASGSNVLFRRRCLEAACAFDPEFQPVEDWEFWLRMARRWPFALVPRYQVFYRFGTGSASTNVERYVDHIRKVVDREMSQGPSDLKARRDECLANASQHAAILCLARIGGPTARRRALDFLKESIRAYPKTLFARRTWSLIGCLVIVYLVRHSRVARVARTLLRLYGKWMMLVNAELRREVKRQRLSYFPVQNTRD